MRAGVAVAEVTPRSPVAMSGFAARTAPSSGVHDPLLVQALCVGDTALVTVDVVGLDEAACAEIRRRCPVPADRVVVHATHTHGGPVSMPGRLGPGLDPTWLEEVVGTCVDAVGRAAAAQVPVTVRAAAGERTGVARNRRRPDGPVDDVVPVVQLVRTDGTVLATVVSYACHPVVLGADNTLLTADYPAVVRRRVSAATSAPTLFVTGCAGDANTGHSAQSSISTAAAPGRTFETCEEVGARIADAVLAARPVDAPGPVTAAGTEVRLAYDLPPLDDVAADRRRWARERAAAPPAERALVDAWIAWADRWLAGAPRSSHHLATVSVLRWGGALLVALPGEPSAVAARAVRESVRAVRRSAGRTGDGVVPVVAGYSNGCPGYLPSADEYAVGGYEVEDAHRYYGAPGPFAAGSLEGLLDATTELVGRVLERP
ncbi:alkaline ceramidase [Georgenia muralis]|uniref:Neutral/alkaline ceramidase-like enzyme n=1 Tax=Georgenia muralis TaxID=154117 RepID=A0A3N5A584_9MICO|nr:alkaline ceramidase [Georgenia muralis]RPF26931.1 hypothetical protein EDD32_1391 [Georgenia muralis]